MELDISKITPTKEELSRLAEKYQGLQIQGVNDRSGYLIVDEARKDLKSKRVQIKKMGKALRDDALKFQRKVIEIENELVGIIEPLELELKAKQDQINEEKLKIQRQECLPERIKRLEEFSVVLPDDELLRLSDEEFEALYIEKKSKFLAEKERKLKEEEEALRREKELEEARKQARIEAEIKAAKEAKQKEEEAKKREERIRQEAEAEKQKLIEEQKRKNQEAEAEKNRLIAEQKRKEKEATEEKSRIIKAQKEKEHAEAVEKKRLEGLKRFQEFLKKNGYTEEDKGDFYIQDSGDSVTLFRKVASFKK